MRYTTQREVRKAFWNGVEYARVPGWTQNQYCAEIRMAFCGFVDYLQKSGQISESLADEVTL